MKIIVKTEVEAVDVSRELVKICNDIRPLKRDGASLGLREV
jgi:hypothetical protein